MQSYLDLLKHVLANGESHDDRTGVGTISVFGYQWRHDMRMGFPLLTTKRVALRWVAEELRWFLSGSTNEKDLRERGVDIWKEWATAEECAKFGREEGDLGPIYGKLWRGYPVEGGVVDQIARLVSGVQQTPGSRRLIVTGWHPQHCDQVSLPPCHTLWQVKCHDAGGISLALYARSIDAFLGLPFNIASYGLLLHVLGAIVGRQPRDLIISFGDLHIYKNHMSAVETQLARDPRPLPSLEIRDAKSVNSWTYQLTGYDPHPKIKADVAV